MRPREDLFPAPHHPTAAPRAGRAAHRLRVGWLPEATTQSKGGRGLVVARGALEHRVQGAPSNTRLELAAPGS